MKKYAIIMLTVLGLASCSDKKFHVEGEITEAEDSVLYLENVGINEINAIDSAKLEADGSFKFSGEATEAPEFYRLRIADQIINIAIDSTETINVKASYPKMATEYEISGSENCQKIKELAKKQMELQRKAILISSDERLTVDESNDSILGLIRQYKKDVKSQYIFPDPSKSYAYFALFQTLGNMLLFNPRTDKDDIKAFAAVATSWDGENNVRFLYHTVFTSTKDILREFSFATDAINTAASEFFTVKERLMDNMQPANEHKVGFHYGDNAETESKAQEIRAQSNENTTN